MEKIAVISDIHGNLEALKIALKDIKEKNIKKIICLGDIIGKGNHPNECIELLKDATIVYGNWEEFYSKKVCSTEQGKKRYNYLDKILTKENKEFINKLPLSYELYISGRLVRFFHASPDNPWSNILSFDRFDKMYNQFLPSKETLSQERADVIVYGHTHTPNMMKLYNRTLINAGSVGNAFDIIDNTEKNGSAANTTTIDYLIIAGDINSKEYTTINYEFVSISYDINKELNNGLQNPEYEVYSEELLTGKFRNVKKYQDNFLESNYDIDKL